jgi:hypothetical protein
VDPSGQAQMQTRLPAQSASVQCDGAWDSSTIAAARDGYVDMHGVPQRLGFVDLPHPDRRSVSQRVDRIVVRHRSIAEYGAPKAYVDRVALGRDREQCPSAREPRRLCDGLRQARRFAQRSHPKYRGRPAMQHHPVVDALPGWNRL